MIEEINFKVERRKIFGSFVVWTGPYKAGIFQQRREIQRFNTHVLCLCLYLPSSFTNTDRPEDTLYEGTLFLLKSLLYKKNARYHIKTTNKEKQTKSMK